MALFDAWYKPVQCPLCRTQGAEKFLFLLRCPNPQCPKFDAEWARESSRTRVAPTTLVPLEPPAGTFDPGPDRFAIRYRNFQGFDREYTADRRTGRRRGNNVSFRVKPTGRRINFNRRFIQNLAEVDALLAEKSLQPNARERQVLGYHKKFGTTSPLYEQIRQKFPHWQP